MLDAHILWHLGPGIPCAMSCLVMFHPISATVQHRDLIWVSLVHSLSPHSKNTKLVARSTACMLLCKFRLKSGACCVFFSTVNQILTEHPQLPCALLYILVLQTTHILICQQTFQSSTNLSEFSTHELQRPFTLRETNCRSQPLNSFVIERYEELRMTLSLPQVYPDGGSRQPSPTTRQLLRVTTKVST